MRSERKNILFLFLIGVIGVTGVISYINKVSS
jgi:hypothetical protein